jgi:outer membrane receptor protein involved in Fe transport
MNINTISLAAAGILAAGPVAAQAPSQPPQRPSPPPTVEPKAAAETVEGLTVTADPQAFRSSIDRLSYGVANDLQTTTGSIADALRNVPSVQVDARGDVSLRGDSSVTIMIDGRPSGMFRGEGRGQALQQLPADQIERVEVLTNPSAAFSPEGSAGVINLITKKARGVGRSGSVRTNVGTAGRSSAGVSAAYNGRALTLSGDLSARHESQKTTGFDERSRLDPATGRFTDSRQTIVGTGAYKVLLGRGSVDYDLDARTRVGAELRFNIFDFDTVYFDSFHVDDPDAGPGQVLDRVGRRTPRRGDGEATATFRRKFIGDDHELTASVSHERIKEEDNRHVTEFRRLPPLRDRFETLAADRAFRQTELKADYTRPMPEDSKLKVGYQFLGDDNDYNVIIRRGGMQGDLPIDPMLSHPFLYEQAIHAAYATYERPFGDLTVLAGLRLEDVRIDLDEVAGEGKLENDYFRAYPSLHLSYRLSEEKQLRLSYSLRVQRPQPQDFNPFPVYQDPFSYRAGNPRLKPQETHSYEASYQHRRSEGFYLATLYYRQSSKGLTDVVRDLGGGVLLTTRENLGEGRSGGLELVANGKLHPKLTYNVSGNALWNEIEASTLGFPGTRSGYSMSGRGSLNWQVTASDFIQINGFLNGKRLIPQGYLGSMGMLNLGYRRKVTDTLSVVVTAQDVLGTARELTVIDSPTLKGRAYRKFHHRGVFVGLTWTFAGTAKAPQDQGFEF